MNERQVNILETLSTEKKIEVKQLAALADVSEVTIRKDLEILENQGLLKREHGYAVANGEDNINYRLAFGYPQKFEIAQKALKYIEPNETVIIESGSTCTLLALEIAKRDQNNTIITNSTFIARYLKDYPTTKVILLAGQYQGKSEAVVGPLIRESIKNFHTDKIFVGADGIHETFGVAGSNYERTEAAKMMRENASNVFVLSQSYKLDQKSNYHLFSLDDIQYLITDDQISEDERHALQQHDIVVD